MTPAGSDSWFGSALSGSDGTAEPRVRQRPDQVYTDPTAAPLGAHRVVDADPIVLPPVHLQATRAQIEQLLDGEPDARRPPPRSAPPVRSTPPRTPSSRPPAPAHVVHAPPVGPPPALPPTQQWGPPPPLHQGGQAPANPWAGANLPAPLTNFLAGLQQQGLPQQAPPRQPRPPQPARRSGSIFSCFTVLFVIGLVLLVSGAGEQLYDVIHDLLNR